MAPENELEEGVAVEEEPEDIFSEEEETETPEPEEKEPESSEDEISFNKEVDQYDKEFGEAEKSYYPKATGEKFDSDGKSSEEIDAHIESVRQEGILSGMKEVSRTRHDGRDGRPQYDDAINDSGLREQWQREQSQGNGPLIDFLEKKGVDGTNPYEVAYGLAVSRLQKSGKIGIQSNGSDGMADAIQDPPAQTEKQAPRRGLAGTSSGGTPKKARWTATKVAGLTLEQYEKLPVEVRERAKGNPEYGDPLPEV